MAAYTVAQKFFGCQLIEASGYLSMVAIPWQGCNKEVACVTLSVAKHWIGGLIIQVNIYGCIALDG